MSKNVDVLAVMDSIWNRGLDGSNVHDFEAARSAVAELIESTCVLRSRLCLHGDWEDGCYYYNGYSAPELQDPMAQVDAALIRIKGEA